MNVITCIECYSNYTNKTKCNKLEKEFIHFVCKVGTLYYAAGLAFDSHQSRSNYYACKPQHTTVLSLLRHIQRQ